MAGRSADIASRYTQPRPSYQLGKANRIQSLIAAADLSSNSCPLMGIRLPTLRITSLAGAEALGGVNNDGSTPLYATLMRTELLIPSRTHRATCSLMQITRAAAR